MSKAVTNPMTIQIIPPLLSKEEIDAMDSGDESNDESMSTEMLEDICDGIQSHPSVNRREAHYKIRHRIKKRQSERKIMLKATQSIGKGSHKLFKTVVKEISQDLPHLGEYSSEVSYFILEPRTFAEVTKLSYNINKPWLKVTQKEI